MNDEINNILTLLECTIKEAEDPDYIELSYQLGHIYILCSKKDYKHMSLYDRIMRISALLEFEHEDVMEKYPVIIETYDEDQLKDLFEMYGRK